MKKLALALLLPFAFTTMPACTDTEVGVGVGLVGGALIGAAVASSYGDYYYDNDYRPYYGCVGYNNWYGSYANECGYGYGYGGHYRHGYYSNSPELMAKTGPKGVVVSGRAAHFAMKNKVSFSASERLVQAFDRGAQGDLAPLAKLGMTRDELAAIYDGQMPSSRAMNKLASSLNMSSSKMHTMMRTVVSRVQEQRGNY